MKHRSVAALALGLAALIRAAAVAVLISMRQAYRPIRVQFATSSGLTLHAFFDGVRPSAVLKERLKKGPAKTPRTCGRKDGAVSRILSALGLSLTVSAQSYCEAIPCGNFECYSTVVEYVCLGYCPDGVYTYEGYSSDDMSSFSYTGASCCQNTEGCGCFMRPCFGACLGA